MDHYLHFRVVFRRIPLFFVAFLCLFPLLLSGCTAPSQPDLLLLRDSIKKEAPQFAFSPASLSFRDGIYYTFFSLHSENDLLMTMRENERGKIDRVTLTARQDSAVASQELPAFAELLSRLLIPGSDPLELQRALGFEKKQNNGQGAPASFYHCGKYMAALYRGQRAVCFLIEKREEETATGPSGAPSAAVSDP